MQLKLWSWCGHENFVNLDIAGKITIVDHNLKLWIWLNQTLVHLFNSDCYMGMELFMKNMYLWSDFTWQKIPNLQTEEKQVVKRKSWREQISKGGKIQSRRFAMLHIDLDFILRLLNIREKESFSTLIMNINKLVMELIMETLLLYLHPKVTPLFGGVFWDFGSESHMTTC